jgi:hypothetical protein
MNRLSISLALHAADDGFICIMAFGNLIIPAGGWKIPLGICAKGIGFSKRHGLDGMAIERPHEVG